MPLHPVFAQVLESARAAGRPGLSEGSVLAARALVDDGAKPLGAGPPVHAIRDHQIPTRTGRIGARLFVPNNAPTALMVYFHGGGWVAGSVNSFEALARTLAVRTGCSVLSVEYRLAPEHPFPAGLEDAQDALRWASEYKGELAVDGCKLVVGGDSAGANLATVAALTLGQEIELALQVLFYPVTDCSFDTPSYREHGTGLSLTKKDMAWFFNHYAPPSQWADPRVSPLRAALIGAPPTWLALAEYDVLCSEGQAYAARLAQAGVSVHSQTYSGLTHGFARWFNLVESVSTALDDAALAIRSAVSVGTPDHRP